ncbi:MAG: hypothetical protein WCK78_05895 [Paludibacter sp.]
MEKKDNKEINLLQLLEILINWVKLSIFTVIRFLGHLIQLLYRHIIITCFVLIVCVAGGLYFSRPEVREYKAEALGLVFGNDVQTIREVSRQLENASSINKQISFAKKLNLPDSIANNILSFNSYYVIEYIKDHIAITVDFSDNFSQKDTMYMKMSDRVFFRLKVKNINQIPIIENAIVNYFNNNTLIQTHFQNGRKQISDQIYISKKELLRIDSLAKINYFKENNEQLRFDKNKLVVGEQEKQLFYKDLIKLQERLSYAECSLINYKQPLEIPSGFTVYPTPINGPIKYSFYGLFIGLIISLIISGLLENLNKINIYLKIKD